MELTPFHDIPKSTFIWQMITPGVIILGLVWMSVGIFVNSASFSNQRTPSAVGPFWEASLKLDQTFMQNIRSIPAICWSGNTTNEFQKHQCDEYWNQLIQDGGLVSAPVICTAFLFWVALIQFTGLYLRAQKKIKKGKVSFGGVVTHPAQAPADIFSWFYCLRPITIELKNKSQMTVYVSSQVPKPLPGETIAVFEIGKGFGQNRHLGIVYAPHIAVFRGD